MRSSVKSLSGVIYTEQPQSSPDCPPRKGRGRPQACVCPRTKAQNDFTRAFSMTTVTMKCIWLVCSGARIMELMTGAVVHSPTYPDPREAVGRPDLEREGVVRGRLNLVPGTHLCRSPCRGSVGVTSLKQEYHSATQKSRTLKIGYCFAYKTCLSPALYNVNRDV